MRDRTTSKPTTGDRRKAEQTASDRAAAPETIVRALRAGFKATLQEPLPAQLQQVIADLRRREQRRDGCKGGD